MSGAGEDLSTFLVRNKLISGKALAGLLKAWQDARSGGAPRPLHDLAIGEGIVDPVALQQALSEHGLRLASCGASGRSQVFSGDTPGVCSESGESFAIIDVEQLASRSAASAFGQEQTLFQEGDQIGRYTITKLLGVGSAGEVYHGHDPMADRQVALKLLRLGSETSAQRFMREGRLLANLQHPNIVALFDLNMEADPRYLVMEYVEGQNLDEMLQGEHEVEFAVEIVRMSAAGVAFAHSKGVIHRDLKPANILIDRDGTAKVTDFGLAKAESSDELTIMGETIGTPTYMAPEQIRGDLSKIGPPTDVYALGVLLFHVLTGQLPFDGRSAPEVFQKALMDEFPSARLVRSDVPAALDNLCKTACAKEPEERPQTAGDFEAALIAAVEGKDSKLGSLLSSVRSFWKRG